MKNFVLKVEQVARYSVMALAFLAFTGCSDDDDDNKAPAITEQDRTFAREASYSNLAEIEMGNLALQNSTDNEVKAFAQMMITDHTAAQTELETLADNKNIALPDTVRPADKMLKMQLQNMTGLAFDTMYMKTQVDAHILTRGIMQTEINQGSDTQLKAYANNKLPKINHHLQEAEELYDMLTP